MLYLNKWVNLLSDVGMEFRAVCVSTVRSRHRVSHQTDSAGEFGFLSEAQLVNTALTRAKSWLAVVGDPVALCSIGNCGAVWRSYLKHCQKVSGLHPADLSLEDIWAQAQSLMQLLTVNSVTTDTTQSRAPANVSPYMTSETVSKMVSETVLDFQQLSLSSPHLLSEWQRNISTDVDDTTESTATQAVYDVEGAKAYVRRVMSEDGSIEENNNGYDHGDVELKDESDTAAAPAVDDDDDDATGDVGNDDVMSLADWSLDYEIEPDEIIRELAQVCFC